MKYDLIAEAYKKLLRESIDHPMIEVDGVMRHRHNSLGQPIHHADEGIRNFHRWFGDSKAVDEHGRPMVLYHGTTKDFDAFDSQRIGDNYSNASKGFYFSDVPNVGTMYALKHADAREATNGIPGIFSGTPADVGTGGSNVLPIYLSIKSPLQKTARGTFSSINSVDANIDKLISTSKEENKDGIIIRAGKNTNHGNTYVVFNPSQIKSAIGNNGNFSHPTKITESRFDTISSAYIRQINESIDITPIFNLHVDPTRYEVTSQKTSDYDPEQIDVKFRPKLSNTAVPYDYYTQRKRGQHWYEPELATLSKEDMGEVFERQIPRLKPEYSTEIKTDLSKKLIYRGMSEDEFQNIMKTGKIKSHGDFNLEGQEGLTYFSTDPTSAQFYAHNFAPSNHKATGIHHAYVIGVENPGTGVHIEGTAEHEVGIPHEIDANKIKEIHRGRAYNISDGEYSFKKDWSKGWRSEPTYKPGSHMMPTVHLAWERIK